MLSTAKATNEVLVQGGRTLVFNDCDIGRQASRLLKSAGWGVDSSQPARGVVLSLHSSHDDDEVVVVTGMDNPFLSPSEAKKKSGKPLTELADKINEKLTEGYRTFNVPIGLARSIAAHLRSTEGKAWTVVVNPCVNSLQEPYAATNLRELVVSCDDDALEASPSAAEAT